MDIFGTTYKDFLESLDDLTDKIVAENVWSFAGKVVKDYIQDKDAFILCYGSNSLSIVFSRKYEEIKKKRDEYQKKIATNRAVNEDIKNLLGKYGRESLLKAIREAEE